MAAPFAKIVGPVPVATTVAVAALAQSVIPPLLVQIQAMLMGAFGLGLLQAELVGRLDALLQFGISVSNPILDLQTKVAAILAVLADLQAQLAIGVPTVQFSLAAQLELIAEIQIKLGGINALIDAILGVQIPVVNLIGAIEAAFGLGNVVLYAWSGQTVPQALGQMNAYDFAGDTFGAATQTYGVLFVTATPSAGASFKLLFNNNLPT